MGVNFVKIDIQETEILNSIKKDYKEILIDELKFINALTKKEWAITLSNKKIRIYLGQIIIFSIENSKIWLPIDFHSQKKLVNVKEFIWDDKDYPEYNKGGIKSRNGYFFGTKLDWENIVESHRIYLSKLRNKNYKLLEKTRKNQNNRIINYLVNDFPDEEIPYPDYEVEKVINELMGLNEKYKKKILKVLNNTDKEQYVKGRIGQNIFRNNLLVKYDKCLLCEIDNEKLLRASHIKPWRNSNDFERIDDNNGLLLCANHDILFDNYLISFDENGIILIADCIKNEINELNLDEKSKIIIENEMEMYMKYHRKKFKERNYT